MGETVGGAAMTTEEREKKKDLFFKYVWDHTTDDFYASFDIPPERQDILLDKAVTLLNKINLPDKELIGVLEELLSIDGKPDIEFLSYIIQIAGYTRSKILVDLQAKGVKKPSSFESLIGGKRQFKLHDSWEKAVAMLVKRLRDILRNLAADDLRSRLKALDLATYPGYIRQQRAKHVGHYAEKKLAEMLYSLSIPFVPKEKKDNPLSRDATLNEQSFDLVIPNTEDPQIAIKSTVHTSNTGQYGESKDKLEIKEAREALQGSGVILVAFADGVGYKSNADALNGLFDFADEVVQFATMWKIPAMAAKRLDLGRLVVAFSEAHRSQIEDFGDFIERWGVCVDSAGCGGARRFQIDTIAEVCLDLRAPWPSPKT